jgi:hypothetical protein
MKILNNKKIIDMIYMILIIFILVGFCINYSSYVHKVKGGDEGSYLYFADNLLEGFYSPTEYEKIRLWHGPGYPLVLASLKKLGVNYIGLRYFNLLFLIISIILIFQIIKLNRFENKYKYTLASLILLPWGIPIDFYVLHTESLVLLLITLISYFYIKNLIKPKRRFEIYVGLLIGFLSLVKPIFVYVCLLYWIYRLLKYLFIAKDDNNPILKINYSLILILPYLLYTFNLTNKLFYTSTAGGMQFYSMTIRENGHTGEWLGKSELIKNNLELKDLNNRGELYCDSAYKALAIINLKQKPINYVKNLISNAFRLITFRFSYDSLLTMFTFIVNIFVIFKIALHVKNLLKFEIVHFFLIYLLISLLFSAYYRFSNVIYPLFFCLIMFQNQNKKIHQFR